MKKYYSKPEIEQVKVVAMTVLAISDKLGEEEEGWSAPQKRW